ncbi:hypothetical protein [Lachnobacterium bovis]|uniref:hypothetical protein n=1 Tax=Lachnobacterium bovis TaxID=140626 RepID=UPI0018658ACB|nr:hypothetical protein [Lachnobacterium bovis]
MPFKLNRYGYFGAVALVGFTGGTAAPLVVVVASGFITGAGIEKVRVGFKMQ